MVHIRFSQKRRLSATELEEAPSGPGSPEAEVVEEPGPTPSTKFTRTNVEGTPEDRQNFTCTLPPGCATSASYFSSAQELEEHHRKHHAYVCSETSCRKIFPDARFLELHLVENHDPLTEVRKDRGEKTFACFESGCDRMFRTPKTRRLHLIDAHHYPKEFFFSLPNHGIGDLFKRHGEAASLIRSGWRPRADEDWEHDLAEESSSPTTDAGGDQSVDGTVGDAAEAVATPDDGLAEGVRQMDIGKSSAPNQIRFGRGTGYLRRSQGARGRGRGRGA